MTPNKLSEMLLPSPLLDKLARSNKHARKAVQKCNRKLRAALKAKDVTRVRLLIGMAAVALSKAEFIARLNSSKGH